MPRLIILFCLTLSLEAKADLAFDIRSRVDGIVSKSNIKKSELGMFVSDAKDNVYFTLNAEKRFIPASITKLLTTAAVMNELHADYKFHTLLYVDGVQTGQTLKGNIYLKGGGDPAFVSEKMWMLVDEFLRTGIKKVTGSIYVDDSYFDDERFDKGRESDRNDRAYDAPVGGLSFNWNSTMIFIRPGKAVGDKAGVFIDPENDYVELINKVTTSRVGTDLTATKMDKKDKNTIVVSGKIAVDASEHHIYKNISDPALYAGNCLIKFLHERGVQIEGIPKRQGVPGNARLAVDQKGEPLGREITDMNKFSNNFVAEMLAKNLGAVKKNGQGRMQDGVEQVRSFLERELSWKPAEFNLANVSGFTRKNSFTASQFVSLLQWIQGQFRIYPEILQSLPIAGVDGTLEKRMKGTPGEGWVRAKTGLLNGVVALSGFAGRPGNVLMFAFIYNGPGDEAHVRSTFDAAAASLVQ